MKKNGKELKKQQVYKKFFRFVKKEKTDIRDVEYIGNSISYKKFRKVCGLNVALQKPGAHELYAALDSLDIPNGEYVLAFNSTMDGCYFGGTVMKRKPAEKSTRAAVAV